MSTIFRSEVITPEFKDLHEMKQLYRSAFPARERQSLPQMLSGEIRGTDALAFYENDVFCGFACLLTSLDITHILYLAILPEMRNHHYGSLALGEIHKHFPDNRIIADLEAAEEGTENYAQRISRIHFYTQNGYERTDIAYRWKHEDYVIYSHGGNVTQQEFDAFWEDVGSQGEAAARL